MKEEYNYTLTVPLADSDAALTLLEEIKRKYPQMRASRKPDTPLAARFYLSFPFSGTRTDTNFQGLMESHMRDGWELFGPNYGVWGFK